MKIQFKIDTGDYGPEVEKIFVELVKSKTIEKMTESERLNFQENLKKLIDCENIEFYIKMLMVSQVVWFPMEVKTFPLLPVEDIEELDENELQLRKWALETSLEFGEKLFPQQHFKTPSERISNAKRIMDLVQKNWDAEFTDFYDGKYNVPTLQRNP